MPRRWEREQAIAQQYMANARARVSFGLACIDGEIPLENKYGAGVRDSFRVLIIYPSDFLHALTDEGFVDDAPTYPSVYLMSHRALWAQRIDGHILSDWSLCLYVPGEAGIEFRDPDSLLRLLEVTKAFLMLERIYQRRVLAERVTGVEAEWPGPQRSHGLPGYLEAVEDRGGILDTEPCICGSGKRYARCHKRPLLAYEALKSVAA
jgi:hypothetical protein